MTQARRKTAALPLKPVPRGTLPDEIYRQIKELILDGGIAPGELMTIQGLADGFGVSAMPVREALQRLTAEKALTIVSGRSVGIPELKASRLRDLYKVRLEVETMATVWGAEAITGQDISRLEGLVAMMARAIRDGDSRQYLRGNYDFHFTVYRASGSETMIDIIEGLWLQVSPYFHSLRASGNYVASNRQHEAVTVALRSRDAAAASAAMRADLQGAQQVLLDLLD
jgi:DNA-binding GntR family transcriptional regulator